MNHYTVYLCGPIFGRSDSDAFDWREEAKRRIAEWPWAVGAVKALDPMRRDYRDYRGREDDPQVQREIVELDLLDVARVDALLVYYDKPSVGTAMEVFHAFRNGKFVVVVNAPGEPLSPWLQYHSHRVVRTLGEALAAIRERIEDFE